MADGGNGKSSSSKSSTSKSTNFSLGGAAPTPGQQVPDQALQSLQQAMDTVNNAMKMVQEAVAQATQTVNGAVQGAASAATDAAASAAQGTASATEGAAAQPAAKSGPRASALVVVDMQNDFCAGGAMAVPGSDDLVEKINSLRGPRGGGSPLWDVIVFTQDTRPKDHTAFGSGKAEAGELVSLPAEDGVPEREQIVWPTHCLEGTPGWELKSGLRRDALDEIVRKGTNRLVDSYSAFGDGFGGQFEDTGLRKLLEERGITDLYVCGVAVDFCVGFTCKDAANAGLAVHLVEDASRGLSDETVAREKEAMTELGVQFVTAADVLARLSAPQARL